jgi:hypothetical protein
VEIQVFVAPIVVQATVDYEQRLRSGRPLEVEMWAVAHAPV